MASNRLELGTKTLQSFWFGCFSSIMSMCSASASGESLHPGSEDGARRLLGSSGRDQPSAISFKSPAKCKPLFSKLENLRIMANILMSSCPCREAEDVALSHFAEVALSILVRCTGIGGMPLGNEARRISSHEGSSMIVTPHACSNAVVAHSTALTCRHSPCLLFKRMRRRSGVESGITDVTP